MGIFNMSISTRCIAIDSSNTNDIVNALNLLCRETKYFCFKPRDYAEALISLSWAETIQFTDVECIKDTSCALNVLRSFAEVLTLALDQKYTFTIDIRAVRSTLDEILKSNLKHFY